MIFSKSPTICVIGLGYVGLPLAVMFGKSGLKTYGFARTKSRIDELKKNKDSTNEVTRKQLQSTKVEYSNDPEIIKKSNFIIVAVPTPVDSAHVPDLSPVMSASELVGKNLQKNSVVVFESTVYPGVTEDVCVPIIEKHSGLKVGKDWVIGYSPERTNPGDKEHTPDLIVKVTSGMDEKSGKYIDNVYKKVIKAGTFLAKDIRTAEASKVIENTQRDINIAIMNELAIIFDKLHINTSAVLEAAGTKWNFLKFKPGLVGGHCIGVDPYYLVYKAEMEGINPQLISAARRINDGMAPYCATQIVKLLTKTKIKISGSKILIMGGTFKEDVKDSRNSKVAELIGELQEYGIEVFLYEPHLAFEELGNEFHIDKKHYIKDLEKVKLMDGICYAVDHSEFKKYSLSFMKKLCKKKSIFFDIKSKFVDANESILFSYKNL